MDALPRGFEQEFCAPTATILSKSATFFAAFAGFSAESGEKPLAESRFSEANGLARSQ
jgi:hypothetical protein